MPAVVLLSRLVDEHASAVNWLSLGGFLAFINLGQKERSRVRDSLCGVSYWRLYDKKGKLTWAPLFHFPKPRIACWLLISVLLGKDGISDGLHSLAPISV